PELGALDRRHGPLEPVRAGLDPRQRRVLVVDHQPGRQHPPGLRRAQVGPPGWAVALRSPHPLPPLPQGARGRTRDEAPPCLSHQGRGEGRSDGREGSRAPPTPFSIQRWGKGRGRVEPSSFTEAPFPSPPFSSPPPWWGRGRG